MIFASLQEGTAMIAVGHGDGLLQGRHGAPLVE